MGFAVLTRVASSDLGKRPRGARAERQLLETQFESVKGRFWPVSDRRRRPASPSLSLGLFGHLQSIIHLYAKIAYGTLQFGMTEEQLDSPQILCPSVNQRGLRPT